MATIRTYRDLYPDRKRWLNPVWFDLYADLSETESGESGCCPAWDDRYGCTRPSGHLGPHIADDGDDVLAVWKDPTIEPAGPTDTALLDWLASLPTDDGYSRWRFRRSTSGRGWRLLTTSEEPNYPTPREALIAAFEECKREVNSLFEMLGDGEQ